MNLTACNVTCGEGYRNVSQDCMAPTCGGTHSDCGVVGSNRTIIESCEIWLDYATKSCDRKSIS